MGDLQGVADLFRVVKNVGDVAWMCGCGRVVEVEVEAEFSFDADAVVGRVGGVAEGILAGLKVFEGGDGGADGDVLARVVLGERFAVVGLEVEGSDFI